jgi:hypothetical protein
MKIRIMACITAALLVLTNASVWEGAASIAPGGDLPDEGYYAATNSFPRNTVVDITNLENGKSIRVIVAAGLETPGLLAVLSREAAGLIGLRPRSIGRIRMSQPSDPVAFSRFTEGLASNGDPDYDPRAMVASDPLVKDLYPREENSAVRPADPSVQPALPGPAAETGPDVEGGEAGYDEIVDIPGFYNPPASSPEDDASSKVVDEGIAREPNLTWVYVPDGTETAGDREEPAEAAEAEETPEEWRIAEAEKIPEAVELPDPLETTSDGKAETPETNLAPDNTPETGLRIAGEPDLSEPEGTIAGTGEYDYALVPAEERPPEEYPGSGYTLPPEAEISSVPAPRDAGETVRDYPETSAVINTPPVSSVFSVPVISGLERGKYYLQLGAFSRADAAESELNRIEKTYPLSIQSGGSAEKPVYRILVGPINLGESGALLQRFKSIGYNDAFVRSGS